MELSGQSNSPAEEEISASSPSPTSASASASSHAEDASSDRPFLLRVGGRSLRRRATSDASVAHRRLMRGESFRREVKHAAAETYLITRLALTLLRYLGVGYRWITKFLALVIYALLLMPGFLQVGYYYYFSTQIRRSVVYGEQPRNRLDLYLPTHIDSPRPVVAFVTGGAWIIGYKAWGALLGRRLAERGIIVACMDYRNFPQGTISDMIEDASCGISFVCNNIASYGGDPNRIYVMGQSAGAHIGSCTLIDQAMKECGEGESTYWSTSHIKAYLGISGGYNVRNLVDHFHERGLYRTIFLSIMEGEQSLERFSPELVVQELSKKNAISSLPRFILFHGTSDHSIPSSASKTFFATLQGVGAKADLILYEGKTHTDLFLQDPLRGGRDELLEDIVLVIYANDDNGRANVAAAPLPHRLVPELMLKLARKGLRRIIPADKGRLSFMENYANNFRSRSQTEVQDLYSHDMSKESLMRKRRMIEEGEIRST